MGKMIFVLKKISYMKWKLIQTMIDGYYYDDTHAELISEFDNEKVRVFNKCLTLFFVLFTIIVLIFNIKS